MKVKVYAKLNLSLNIVGKQDTFHLLDSVVTSVSVFDAIRVDKRSDNVVTVNDCLDIPTEQNVAYKAAYAFMSEFGTCGVDITVDKGIPVGAGMGGSSADIAGVVYCMCKLFGIEQPSLQVYNLCCRLGSDVNYMLKGGLARMRGKGDEIETYPNNRKMYFAVTTFEHQNSTAEIYSQFDKVSAGGCIDNYKLLEAITQGKAFLQGNELQQASQSLSDYAESFLNFARINGFLPNMTGSGSAYYINCDTENAAKEVADLFNSHGFNTFVCHSVPFGIEQIK